MMISNINYVKKTMGELHAKKKFGQNFLIDSNIVDKIAKNACNRDYLTIEIGPGLGSLTEMLLKYSKAVDAYEIDEDMCRLLKENLVDERLNVYLKDFLDVDLSIYQDKTINVCSNLPYYVTTPILFKLFESRLNISKITVMVQREVADRFKARVNDEDYNALSIIVQYLYDVKFEMSIPKTVFYPSPKVDSAVISFTPKIERNMEYEKKLFSLIKNCFVMRRKTLHNNLKNFLDEDTINKIYTELKLDKNVRAQELSLTDFININELI